MREFLSSPSPSLPLPRVLPRGVMARRPRRHGVGEVGLRPVSSAIVSLPSLPPPSSSPARSEGTAASAARRGESGAPSCVVCHRSISVTAAGLVRLHGPVRSRCPGSRKPPLSQVSSNIFSQPPIRGPYAGNSPQDSLDLPPAPSRKLLKRIPRGSREACAYKLTTILEATVRQNDVASWDRLLHFAACCLYAPPGGGGGVGHWLQQ